MDPARFLDAVLHNAWTWADPLTLANHDRRARDLDRIDGALRKVQAGGIRTGQRSAAYADRCEHLRATADDNGRVFHNEERT